MPGAIAEEAAVAGGSQSHRSCANCGVSGAGISQSRAKLAETFLVSGDCVLGFG